MKIKQNLVRRVRVCCIWTNTHSVSPSSFHLPWHRNTTDLCNQQQGSLFSHPSNCWVISPREAGPQYFSIYLQLPVTEAKFQVSVADRRGATFFHPIPTPETQARPWIRHDENTGVQMTLDPAHLQFINQRFQPWSDQPIKLEDTADLLPPSAQLLEHGMHREKCATVPTPQFKSHDTEILARGRAYHKTEGSKALPKKLTSFATKCGEVWAWGWS